jgi:hypothetical protein
VSKGRETIEERKEVPPDRIIVSIKPKEAKQKKKKTTMHLAVAEWQWFRCAIEETRPGTDRRSARDARSDTRRLLINPNS